MSYYMHRNPTYNIDIKNINYYQYIYSNSVLERYINNWYK